MIEFSMAYLEHRPLRKCPYSEMRKPEPLSLSALTVSSAPVTICLSSMLLSMLVRDITKKERDCRNLLLPALTPAPKLSLGNSLERRP